MARTTARLALVFGLASCSTAAAPRSAVLAKGEASPAAAGPRCPTSLTTAMQVPSTGSARLLGGTGRAALYLHELEVGDDGRNLERSHGWYELDATGPTAQPEQGVRLAAIRDSTRGELGAALGHAPIVSVSTAGGWTHVRALAAPQPVNVPGELRAVVALDGGSEGWLLRDHDVDRIAIVDAEGAVEVLPMLPELGPEIVGLSAVGQEICQAALIWRLAGRGSDLTALVTGCHRDAPLRLATYGSGQEPSVWVGPSLEAQDFVPFELLVDDIGPVVIGTIGSYKGAPALARPSGDQWTIQATSAPPGMIVASAVGAGGAIWIERLTDKGVRELHCDGAAVAVRDDTGHDLHLRELAADRDAGVVVLAFDDDGAEWLLVERRIDP